MSILVVEDDEDSLDLLELILKEEGFDPITSTNGIRGLELLKGYSDSIELILLDIMMPEMDGFEFLSRMSQNPEMLDIPVIVVTALDEPGNVQKAFSLGAFDYVTKPYDSIALIARTRSAINFSRARSELKKKNNVLQELIHETDAQKKRLEEHMAYMEDLIDILDHKIRNKLVPISNYSLTFMDMADEEPIKKAMKNINISSTELEHTINEILSDMKQKAGSSSAELNTVDIRSLLSGIEEKIKPSLQENGLAIDIDIDEGVPEQIRTDLILLHDIIDNLISNSIKYTEPGGQIQVTIRKEKGCLVTSIEDTGRGISKEHIERIFERDFIIPIEGLDKKINRTGMGLFLVKRSIKILGGDIEVWSELNKGSRFTFKIPI
jgi:signal transduction histidine kinase